jgi:hypothetical protein
MVSIGIEGAALLLPARRGRGARIAPAQGITGNLGTH